MYMDRRCVYYRKPLLESGTLGTKGNVQVCYIGVRTCGYSTGFVIENATMMPNIILARFERHTLAC